ncbi:MAG TPA: CHRD domain-containing protein [Thermoanaerobaculia bacterium]
MNKRTAALLFLIAILPVAAFGQSFSAQLTGAAEVPGPGDTDGSGFAVIVIDGTTIRYNVLVQNIGTPTGAHIHRGAVGTAGPVVVDLGVSSLASGSVSGVAQSLINEIAGNPSGFYVNVHNAEFPNGAIRGQLGAAGSAGARNTYIPVVGKVKGGNNTNFVSDLRIINQGVSTATVTLDYFAQSTAGHSAPSASQTVNVLPGEQKVLDDVVGATLGVSNGLGGLRITSDQNVVVVTRVINDLRSEDLGTTGFSLNAEEIPSVDGTLPFLISNADFRTNVGYFNASPNELTATFTARSSGDGAVLGSRTITVPGWSMLQQGVFQLISSIPAENQTQNNYYISWSATAPLFVYGSVVDDKTGDSVLVQ